jgi:PAT family beta-lactamase induction signal transducer AmpG
MAEQKRARRSFAHYLRPKAAAMLALGFSSGLPFLLTGNTLGYWLRDEGTTLTAIGFLSWVGLVYSLKFLWAPFIDRLNAPFFGRLGRRRGWMMVAQVLVAAALIGMASFGISAGYAVLTVLAFVVAFSSATQDIVIDAWRIETAEDAEEQGLLTSAYQFGYRGALLVTDALILIAAEQLGWNLSYGLMAVLMAVGLTATFVVAEPAAADAVMEAREKAKPLGSARGIADAIAGPFIAFFRHWGLLALLMLAMIALYRLPDFVMGPMANPFYHDIGLSKQTVGEVRASIGLVASLAGIAAGGFAALRFDYLTALIVGGALQALAIASFSILSYSGGDLVVFSSVMVADNFSTSFAGVALTVYMSSLTSLGYTATQYALLTSAYAYFGKIAKGFSGAIVESLSHGSTLMHAYAVFFIAAGAIGIPAVILCVFLARAHGGPHREVAPGSA